MESLRRGESLWQTFLTVPASMTRTGSSMFYLVGEGCHGFASRFQRMRLHIQANEKVGKSKSDDGEIWENAQGSTRVLILVGMQGHPYYGFSLWREHQVATGGSLRFIASNLQRLSCQQSDDVSLQKLLCNLCGTILNSSEKLRTSYPSVHGRKCRRRNKSESTNLNNCISGAGERGPALH